MSMPTSSTKRKAATDKTEQQRERKRVQNRISQQCFREKQATYLQHLEQFVQSIEKSDGFADSDAAERLRLVRENHALRDVVLDMRKKLLSLGAQATALADVDDDLLRPRETDLTPADSTTRDSSSPKTVSERVNHTSEDGHQGEGPTTVEGTCDELQWPSDAQQGVSVAVSSPRLVDTDISTFFAGDRVKFNPLVGVMVCKPANAISKSTWVLLETKIQKTMEEFNPRSFHDALCIRPITDDLSNSDIQDFENKTLSTIVHLAMQALLKTSRIAGYAHVVCPSPIAEKILIWRMQPTSENRNQIDAPFRPTILQQRFPKHHPAIDLVYWDELRDQLILCQTEIETGMVVHRWHLSSVIEFPDYKVAISVLELFAYLINPALFTLEALATETDIITIPLADCTVKDVGTQFGAMIDSYGLNQFERRKLPALMAEEYPFLDLTNVITHYPVVSVTQFPSVLGHLATP